MSHTIPEFGIYTPTVLYEVNYRRLLRLWPDLTGYQPKQLVALGFSRLCIEIREQFKYTTTLEIKQQLPGKLQHVRPLRMELRACHDACLLEVTGYQGESPIQSARHYPNRKMYQKDEKKQLNVLLKEILENAIKTERQLSRASTIC